DVIGNDVQALAEFRARLAARDIDFAVLFAEPDDFGVGKFNDVAEPAGLGIEHPAVGGERFASGVGDEFSGDGIGDDGALDLHRAVGQRAEFAGHHVRVVVNVGAGTDFGQRLDVMGLIGGRRRSAG